MNIYPKMKVMKARKKPVAIEFMHWDGLKSTRDEITQWSDGKAHLPSFQCYIVKDQTGQFYPVTKDTFDEVYEVI